MIKKVLPSISILLLLVSEGEFQLFDFVNNAFGQILNPPSQSQSGFQARFTAPSRDYTRISLQNQQNSKSANILPSILGIPRLGLDGVQRGLQLNTKPAGTVNVPQQEFQIKNEEKVNEQQTSLGKKRENYQFSFNTAIEPEEININPNLSFMGKLVETSKILFQKALENATIKQIPNDHFVDTHFSSLPNWPHTQQQYTSPNTVQQQNFGFNLPSTQSQNQHFEFDLNFPPKKQDVYHQSSPFGTLRNDLSFSITNQNSGLDSQSSQLKTKLDLPSAEQRNEFTNSAQLLPSAEQRNEFTNAVQLLPLAEQRNQRNEFTNPAPLLPSAEQRNEFTNPAQLLPSAEQRNEFTNAVQLLPSAEQRNQRNEFTNPAQILPSAEQRMVFTNAVQHLPSAEQRNEFTNPIKLLPSAEQRMVFTNPVQHLPSTDQRNEFINAVQLLPSSEQRMVFTNQAQLLPSADQRNEFTNAVQHLPSAEQRMEFTNVAQQHNSFLPQIEDIAHQALMSLENVGLSLQSAKQRSEIPGIRLNLGFVQPTTTDTNRQFVSINLQNTETGLQRNPIKQYEQVNTLDLEVQPLQSTINRAAFEITSPVPLTSSPNVRQIELDTNISLIPTETTIGNPTANLRQIETQTVAMELSSTPIPTFPSVRQIEVQTVAMDISSTPTATPTTTLANVRQVEVQSVAVNPSSTPIETTSANVRQVEVQTVAINPSSTPIVTTPANVRQVEVQTVAINPSSTPIETTPANVRQTEMSTVRSSVDVENVTVRANLRSTFLKSMDSSTRTKPTEKHHHHHQNVNKPKTELPDYSNDYYDMAWH